MNKESAVPSGLLALGLLALATLGFFWQILLAGAWMPAGGGDLAALLYPTYRFAAQSLKSGEIPLWNPYLWGGAPFAADIQASLFYPVNLVYFLLAPEVSYRGLMGLAVFHVWLAGAGMYLYLRRFLVSGALWPPLLGALAFMFSDYFIVHFGNLNLIAQAAWLPFIFLFYQRSLAERRPGLAVWAGVCLAIAASAGHAQPLLIIALGLAWYLLVELGLTFAVTVPGWLVRRSQQVEDSGGRLSARWPEVATVSGRIILAGSKKDLLHRGGLALATFVITLSVGLGLAALALVPAYEMAGYTLRADFDYARASAYSLAPAQLVGLLVPGFFGRDPAAHWGAWDRVEVGYVGVLTLLLALFALLVRSRVSESAGQRVNEATRQPGSEGVREAGCFAKGAYRYASLAAFTLLLAMGGYTVLHGWLYRLVPGLEGVRAPARFVFLMDFALAALAALGLEALLQGQDEWVRPALRRILRVAPWVIGAVVFLAVPLAFYALITSQDKDPVIFMRVSAAANGLVFFTGLLIVAAGLFYLCQRGGLRPGVVGALAVGLLFFDLASLGSNVDVGYDDPTRTFDHPAIVGFLKADSSLYRIDTRTDVWHLWQPNTPLLHGIFDVGGLINPLTLAGYERYWNSIPSRSSPLYDFLNAKYVIAAKDVALDWEKFAPVFDADPALNIYLNRRALPRALVVHRAIAAPDHEAALAALQAPGFDPAKTVVVEGGEALQATPSAAAAIHVESFGLNDIRLRVDTPADAYLVLSEVWYRGWRASVDGASTPVLRANYAFRAVRLGPGEHRVELVFAPRSWTVGLALSGLTLLGVGAWSFVRGVRRN